MVLRPVGRAWPCSDGQMIERKRYPSDLTDERWALIEPVITARKAAHPSVSGDQGGYQPREIVTRSWTSPGRAASGTYPAA